MSGREKWLLGELERWAAEGMVTPEQAERLKARYRDDGRGINWTLVVFASLGAILLGLGVILLFAHNWDKMHKFLKLAVIFAGLVGAHWGGVALKRKGGRFAGAGEALHLFGTMLFGAGIWLIAQIYHIEEHYPNAFMFWGLGALALAWTLPSIAQGLLAAGLLFVWHCCEAADFRDPHALGCVVIAAGLAPLACMLRSRLVVIAAILAFSASLLATAGTMQDNMVLPVLLMLSAASIGAGLLADRDVRFDFAAKPLSLLGWAAYLFVVYACSYGEVVNDALRAITFTPGRIVCFMAPVLLAALAWTFVFLRRRTAQTETPGEALPRQHLAVPIVAMLVVIHSAVLPLFVPEASHHRHFFLFRQGDESFISGGFALIFMFHSLYFVAAGCRRIHAGITSLGCILLMGLVIPKFFTMFDDLLARALAFLLAGAFLVAVGFWYCREKRKKEAVA